MIAVIDTETNWHDRVMSIGVVIAEEGTFAPVTERYYILIPEVHVGGMYSSTINLRDEDLTLAASRQEVLEDLMQVLEDYGVEQLFAYNARFDCRHLPELNGWSWFDIMRLAAYRQYNPCIPPEADCCRTGRLKREYGVEPMVRLLSGNRRFCETHNALQDALDELTIMRLMGHDISAYEVGAVN